MKNKKRVLITGGAGFIGANLARKLISFPDFEVSLIEKPNVDLWRIKNVARQLNIKYVDLGDYRNLTKVIDDIKPQIVFHLAGYGISPFSKNDLREMINTNIAGTLNLAEALKNHSISSFVYTSSGACGEYKKKPSLNQDHFIDPLRLHAVTKLTSELLLREFSEKYNIPLVNLRLFKPYGYYESSERLILYVISNALKNKKIMLSSPDNVRDFIFIEDLIDLFLKVIESNHGYRGEIFNIGSGKEHSVKDIVNVVEKLLHKKLNVVYEAKVSRYSEPKSFLADNTKAKSAFNWRINHDIESGLQKTINWFKSLK